MVGEIIATNKVIFIFNFGLYTDINIDLHVHAYM